MADLKFRTGASATVQKEDSLEKKLAGIMGTTEGNIKSLESQLRREREAEEARKKAEEEARKRAEAAAAAARSTATATTKTSAKPIDTQYIKDLQKQRAQLQSAAAAGDRTAMQKIGEINRQLQQAQQGATAPTTPTTTTKPTRDFSWETNETVLQREKELASKKTDVARSAQKKTENYVERQGRKLDAMEEELKRLRDAAHNGDTESGKAYNELLGQYNTALDLYNQASTLENQREAQFYQGVEEVRQINQQIAGAQKYSDEAGAVYEAEYNAAKAELDAATVLASDYNTAVVPGYSDYIYEQYKAAEDRFNAADEAFTLWKQEREAYLREKTLRGIPSEDLNLFREALEDRNGNAANELRQKYGEEYETILMFMRRQANAEKWQDRATWIADRGAVGDALLSIASVATNFLSAPGVIYEYVVQTRNGDRYLPIDTNAGGFWMQNATRNIRQSVSDDIDSDAWELVYQTAMSGIDSYLTARVFGSKATYVLGATAGANAATDITERGGTVQQAIVGGILAGAIEGFFEDFSIGEMQRLQSQRLKLNTLQDAASLENIKTLVANIAKSTGINFSEEANTEMANIVMDTLLMGDLSEISFSIQQLMANDPSLDEKAAKKIVATELASQIILSGVSGAMMGAAFGAIDTATAGYRTYVANTDARDVLKQAQQTAATIPWEWRPEFRYEAGESYEQIDAYAEKVYQAAQEYLVEMQNEKALRPEEVEAVQSQISNLADVRIRTKTTVENVLSAEEAGRAAADVEASVTPQNDANAQGTNVVTEEENAAPAATEEQRQAQEILREYANVYSGEELSQEIRKAEQILKNERRGEIADALEAEYNNYINGGTTYGEAGQAGVLLSDGQRRIYAESSGRQAGADGGALERRSAAGGTRAESTQGGGTVQQTVWKPQVKSSDLVASGTNRTVHMIPESEYGNEAYASVVHEITRAGFKPVLVRDALTVRRPTGGTMRVNGVATTDGRVILNVGNNVENNLKLGRHEVFHAMFMKAKNRDAIMDRILRTLKNKYSEQEITDMLNVYLDKYKKIYGNNQSVIVEEFLADAYAGMNRFDQANLEKYGTDTVIAANTARRTMEETETAVEGGERYEISETYANELNEWQRNGMPEGELFVLGSTGATLQGLGAIESDVYILGDKIKTILDEHPEMTIEEIKKIPQILEDPSLILKSKNAYRGGRENTRLVLFNTIKAQNNNPIMVVLNLRPLDNNKILIDDLQQVSSAYTKETAPVSFVKNSQVMHADKNRSVAVLRNIGFQMPISLLRNGSVGSISYAGRHVNITGVPFDSVFSVENNQEKNAANLTPTDDPGVRFSVSEEETENDRKAREFEADIRSFADMAEMSDHFEDARDVAAGRKTVQDVDLKDFNERFHFGEIVSMFLEAERAGYDRILAEFGGLKINETAAPKPPEPKQSAFRSNTLKKILGDKVEKYFKTEDYTYLPISEQDSLRAARDRLNTDAEGVIEYLRKSDGWGSSDMDAAYAIMGILKHEADVTHDYSRLNEWVKLMREQNTRAGQMIQANAKYSRNPYTLLLKAEEVADMIREQADASEQADADALANQVMENTSQQVDALNAVEAEDKDALIDIIEKNAEIRKTKVSRRIKNALRVESFEFLRSVATAQIENIAVDMEPVSRGKSALKKIGTYQTMAQLLNLRTAMRNVVSNQVFDIIETVANDASLIPDMVLSVFTKRRAVGTDVSWSSKAKRQGAAQGARRSAIEVSLDVDVSDAQSKYGTKNRRTWNMQSSNWLGRRMSSLEKAMGYELNVTDEFLKQSVYEETMRGFQKYINNGTMTMDEAQEMARQEALYRSFQDDTAPSKLLRGLKNAVNAFGFKSGDVRFGLGDLVQKYTQVPGALISRSIEFSPLGYAKAVYCMFKIRKEGSAGLQAQRQAALAIGRAFTGTGLIALFMKMAKLGILKRRDDEENKDIAALSDSEGVYGTQVNISALFRWIKGESTEWKKGDVLVDVDFMEPINALMSLGTAVASDTERGFFESAIANSRNAIWNAFLETPTLELWQQISETLRYKDDDDNWAKEIAIDFAASSITGFVPSLVRQVAQAMDYAYRDQYYSQSPKAQLGARFANTIPLLRQKLPEKLDNFGDVKDYEDPWINVLNSLFMPGGIYVYERGEISEELARLRETTGEEGMYPPRYAPYNLELNLGGGKREKHELTIEERTRYQTTRGTTASLLMAEYMASAAYENASDEQRAAILTQIADIANDAAKRELYESLGVEYRTDTFDKYYGLVASGMPSSQALDFQYRESALSKYYNYLSDDATDSANTQLALLESMGIKVTGTQNIDKLALMGTYDVPDSAFVEMANDAISAARGEDFDIMLDAGLLQSDVVTLFGEYTRLSKDESMSAYDKATEFAHYVDLMGIDGDARNVVIDTLTYSTGMRATADTYQKYVDAGLDADIAKDIYDAINALEPLPGKDSVSAWQRRQAAVSAVDDVDQQIAAYVAGEDAEGKAKAQAKLDAAKAYGVTPQMYVDFYMSVEDTDGSGGVSQDEVKAVLRGRTDLTKEQKAVLYQLYKTSWKYYNNPYNTTAARSIVDALEAVK